jgi:preprotein translocase subunit SecF
MNIIKHRNIYLGISLALVVASLAGIIAFGFREGIDFQGGTLWQLRFSEPVSDKALADFFSERFGQNISLTREASSGSVSVRLATISEAEHQEYFSAVKGEFGEVSEMGFQSIGPSIGKELKNRAINAFIFAVIGISLYIAYAFRKVSHPVSSWKFGIVALLTLFHDAIIPLGMLSFLGHYKGVEIDTSIIVSLLVIVGFSVHDTIVIFDRIRENLLAERSKREFGEVVNASINQTFARSINTSMTLFLMLVALYVVGPPSLHHFVLTILVGTLAGAYSSIFVASPLLVIWERFSRR